MEPMGDSVGAKSHVALYKLCFLSYVGKAFEPVWVRLSVMWLRDYNEMSLIIPS